MARPPQAPLDEIYNPAPKMLCISLIRQLRAMLHENKNWHHNLPTVRRAGRRRLKKTLEDAIQAFAQMPPDSGRDYTEVDVIGTLLREAATHGPIAGEKGTVRLASSRAQR